MPAGARVDKRKETPRERELRIARKELADAEFGLERAKGQLDAATANYKARRLAVARRRRALEEVEAKHAN